MKKKLLIDDLKFIKKSNQLVKKKFKESNFIYSELTKKQYNYYIKKIFNEVFFIDLVKSGKKRKKNWENGWKENNDLLRKRKIHRSIVPKYFGKYNILRFNNKLIKPVSKNFELNLFYLIQIYYFSKYLKNFEYIYDFGCGTGHNLENIRLINSKSKIYGLDWVNISSDIINRYYKKDNNIFFANFDFFNPNKKFNLKKNSAILTIASLEQTGKNYNKFLKYLLNQKPRLCIHIEPINELMFENNTLDFLSILYSYKRNYLKDYLNTLKTLEKTKKIKIIKAERTFIGSLYLEGYSVIIWKPL